MSRVRGTVLLGAALVLTGIVFASSSLLVPGFGLLLLGGGAVAWVRGSAGATRLEQLPGPSRVIEEEPFPLRVKIARGPLPLPPAELTDPLLGGPVRVGSRGPAVISVALRLPRRGQHSVGPPTLALRDPLGICEREKVGQGKSEVLVLPRIEEVRRADPGSGGRDAGALDGLEQGSEGVGLETGAVDLEIDGLRPYREGSPASRIHWRTVARTGEMFERRFVAGADAAPMVVLDASAPTDEEALDRAVRAAASLAVHLARRGGVAMLLPDRPVPTLVDPRLRTWPDVHARLALVQAGAPAPPARGARGRLASFWVTGADAFSAARKSLRAMPGSFVVTPHPTPGAPVAFTVSGCSGQRALLVARGRARELSAA